MGQGSRRGHSEPAIHLIDLLLWYFGEPVSVYANAGVFRTPTETDDVSVAVMRFKKRGNRQITSTVSAFGEERSRVEVYGSDLTAVSHGSAYAASSRPFRLSARTSRGRGGAARMDERIPSGYRVLHRGAIADFSMRFVTVGNRWWASQNPGLPYR